MFGLNEGDRIVTCPIVRGEILFGISRLPVGRLRSELEQAGNQFLDAFHCETVPEVAGGCNVSAVPIAPLCDVVGILHPHEGVHIDAERLLEAQGPGLGDWKALGGIREESSPHPSRKDRKLGNSRPAGSGQDEQGLASAWLSPQR